MDPAEEKVAISGEYEEVEEEIEEEVEEEYEVEEEDDVKEEKEEVGDQNKTNENTKVDMDTKVENGTQDSRKSSKTDVGKIFVGGVAWDTTEETFSSHFRNYGEITDSVIMKDKFTQKPRGFGFVTFADPSVLDKVLGDEHIIDERKVDVKRVLPRDGAATKEAGGFKTKKIFVGGLPPTYTDDELKAHCSSYGEVVEAQIMVDHATKRSRGFAFVTFASEDAVEKITSKGKMHDIGGKQVEIKKAEPKRSEMDTVKSSSGSRGMYGSSGGSGASTYNYGSNIGYGNAGAYRSAAFNYGGRGAGSYGGGGGGYGYGYGSGYSNPSPGGPMYGGYGSGGPMYGSGYGVGNAYGDGGSGRGRGYGRYNPYAR